jgi:stalled ribosome rescue protein Dom34
METIKPTQYLGIWMDHSVAHLMEYTKDSMETETVESTFTHQNREETLNKSENLMHNKEQQKQRSFYTELAEEIKKYNEVVLFGPTDAKVELFNILKEDHHFDEINIGVENADKMSENQQHAFVRAYFLKTI